MTQVAQETISTELIAYARRMYGLHGRGFVVIADGANEALYLQSLNPIPDDLLPATMKAQAEEAKRTYFPHLSFLLIVLQERTVTFKTVDFPNEQSPLINLPPLPRPMTPKR